MNPEPHDIKMDKKAERETEDHYEEYMRAGVTPGNLEECPHLRKKQAGDSDIFYFCDLTEKPSGRIKPCLDQYGYGCEIYREILKEWENES